MDENYAWQAAQQKAAAAGNALMGLTWADWFLPWRIMSEYARTYGGAVYPPS